MIAYLRGDILRKDFNTIIIDVGGVGYEVMLTKQVADGLIVGTSTELYITEAVREDSFTLFGFSDMTQRNLYFQLNSVSGVGPKATMAILSSNTVEEIEQAIITGSTALFRNVSGIGGKTASRIILDLKGKLEMAPSKQASEDPAYQALLSLGFSAKQATDAIKDLPHDLNLDSKVKEALKLLAK